MRTDVNLHHGDLVSIGPGAPATIRARIDAIYRSEARRVFASLVRLLRDFDLADDALHEAFAAAVERWPSEGVPEHPRAWLISTGRFKAIDALRRQGRLKVLQADVAARLDAIAEQNASGAALEIEDDRLRLIFTCCHPAIDFRLRVPLTLREVCGLTTEEIAHAFLTSKATMAQRIVRGKAKIREAGIPYSVPGLEELPERLDAVLAAIYLVFNEGYSASQGEALIRVDLTAEAIRLGRLLSELLPEPDRRARPAALRRADRGRDRPSRRRGAACSRKVKGLLALMLLHESRARARVSIDGEIILMQDQDRARWDAGLIAEGTGLVEQALATKRFGAYTLQAAISAVHAEAATYEQTDWNQIVVLYGALLRVAPSPVVELNRAVAVAMRDGPQAGLELIERIMGEGKLGQYQFAHSARGELLRRAGRGAEAETAFQRALELARQEPERRFLEGRIRALERSREVFCE